MTAEKILQQLLEFKNLPTYQFERRIDAFILPYLENAFNAIFTENGKQVSDFILVYPEFPLKVLQKDFSESSFLNNASACYADYLLWSHSLNLILFVELKTDYTSVSLDQFNTYIKNCKAGWKMLLENYFYKAGKSEWRKFCAGLKHIEKYAPELLGNIGTMNFDKYLNAKKGNGVTACLQELKAKISFEVEPDVKFTYLAPQKTETFIKAFKAASEPECYLPMVSLKKFSEYTDETIKSVLLQIDGHD